MKFYLKIVIFIIIFHISYFIFPNPIFAQERIESSQTVFYQVHEDGKTRVRHEIRLTNLTTSYYVSEYSLFLGFADLEDIQASDSQGPVKADITPKEKGTEVRLNFNDRVVGKGNILSFSISYTTEEIASKSGRIWEVNIPRIKDSESLGSYKASVSVPQSFGKVAYIKPSTHKGGLTFEKEEILKGISITFGQFQIFDFSLLYHLKNSRLYPIVTEIALPPSTNYQEVLINSLNPAPLTVYQDKDGNWLAKYRIEASAKLDVKAEGKAKITNQPQATSTPLSKDELKEYLKPQKYWDTLDPAILEKAKELKTPENIYWFVVNTLSYDVDRIKNNEPRVGASKALSNPQSAICMEFTDLFIALARAAGIAAREIDGFAFTGNSRLRPLSLVKDILHAWPEYYDEQKGDWIAVDPTWGNTSGVDYFDTLDFNHFAFVVKGFDSEYPSPAGSYKEEGDLEKQDVNVSFAKDETFTKEESIKISMDDKKAVLAGFAIKQTFLIENLGNAIFNKSEIIVSSDMLLDEPQKISLDPIPPFGKIEIPITLKSRSYLDNEAATIKAAIYGEEANFTVRIVPIYLIYLPWIGGGIGAAVLFIIARKAWSIYFQRQEESGSLRGQGKLSSGKSKKLL